MLMINKLKEKISVTPNKFKIYGYANALMNADSLIFYFEFNEVSNEAALVKLLENRKDKPQIEFWVLENVSTHWLMSYPRIEPKEES